MYLWYFNLIIFVSNVTILNLPKWTNYSQRLFLKISVYLANIALQYIWFLNSASLKKFSKSNNLQYGYFCKIFVF